MFPSMSAEDILTRVRRVVVEELGVKEEEVQPNSSFTEDLGADSLDVVELVMALEDEFGLEIPDTDTVDMKTVQDSVDYIAAKLPA